MSKTTNRNERIKVNIEFNSNELDLLINALLALRKEAYPGLADKWYAPSLSPSQLARPRTHQEIITLRKKLIDSGYFCDEEV